MRTYQSETSPGALIIGGSHASLAVARSLGRHGVRVGYVTHDHRIVSFSRYTLFSERWSGPESKTGATELLEIAGRRQLEGWVLFAGSDYEVRFVSQNHDLLAPVFRLTTPPWQTAQVALDKRLTYERAAALGLHHPWTQYPRDRRDAAQPGCPYPVILKPRLRRHVNAFTLVKAWRADNQAAFLSLFDEAAALVGPAGILIQELIPGDGSSQFSYAAVCDHGRPIASLVARRTRQYPIDFGHTSTFVESVDNEDVEAAGRRFLGSLDYTGMAEVEFKRDGRTGQYKLLDVNLRPWTWNGLGRAAGADFAYIAWRLAAGLAVEETRGRAGAAWAHLDRDIVSACQLMLAGIASPIAWARSYKLPITFAAASLDDPLPGIVDMPLLLARLVRRRLPAMGSRLLRRLRNAAGPEHIGPL